MKFVNLANAVRDARECGYKIREYIWDAKPSKELDLLVDAQYWLIELTDAIHGMDITLSANEDDKE